MSANRIAGLREVASDYNAILCDVWGVLHNGVDTYPRAAEALAQFRRADGHVVMITNSPRRSIGVKAQLDEMGVRPDAFDDIVSSGDVTRALIEESSGPVFHLGPDRDLPLYEGLDAVRVPLGEAATIVCTGLFDDESETPEDYRVLLSDAAERDLPLICANPDIVVERGSRLIWCAGALARLYRELGGETRLAGKPHEPIYRVARQRIADLAGGMIDDAALLAIGDGMPTDVAGAMNAGLDLLYISAGIHAADYGDADAPDEKALAAFLKANEATPKHWLPRLVW